MRKAMSKKVGAGGRFDIFLDSGFRQDASQFPYFFRRPISFRGPDEKVSGAVSAPRAVV